jgi:uncharacterized membrane protein YgcG
MLKYYTLVVICVVRLLFVLFGCYLCCSVYCLCVNVYCYMVTTQLQLINESYHIISYIISYHIISYHYAFQNVRFRFYFTFKHKKNIFSLQDLRENSYLAIRSAHKWRVWEALAQDELSHCPTYMHTGTLHVLNMRGASSFKIGLSGGRGGAGKWRCSFQAHSLSHAVFSIRLALRPHSLYTPTYPFACTMYTNV